MDGHWETRQPLGEWTLMDIEGHRRVRRDGGAQRARWFASIPAPHSHASNQFMYCLEGDYEYTAVGMRLRPGDFYMNPKDNPHGPTIAHERSLLIEIYDGPHYYEKPVFHTDESIGGFLHKS